MALGKVTNYVKNLAKSVVYSSEEVLKSIAPTTIAYKEQNADLIKNAYNVLRDPRNAMARTVEYVKSTRVYEAGAAAYHNTLEDLATGKFYNKERENSIGGTAFGMDTDMEFDFDSLDKALEGMDNISDGDKETIKTIEKTTKASTTATTAAIVETARYQAEVSKTNTGVLFAQNERLFGRLQTGIDSINTGINNITKFNVSSFQTHIENSTKFYDVITKNTQEQTAILKEILEMQRNVYKEKQEAAKQNQLKERKKKLGFSDITDSTGAVNIAEYFKIITENVKTVTSDYGLNFLDSFGEGSNPLLAFASNPLSFLPISLVNAAIGPKFKTYAKQLDKSFSGMFGTLIARLNSMAKKDDDPISQFLGKLFGIKNTVKTSIDTARYAKGAISFDGVTKEAIVNVIPTYLAKIESAITGMSERIYDYEYGKWTTGEELAKRMRNEQKSTVRSAFSDVISAFGDIKSRNKIKFESLAQETQFSKDMDAFFLSIYTKGGYFNPNNPGSHIDWGVSTKENFDALVAMYKTLPKHVQMSVGQNVIDARTRYTQQMERYEDDSNSPYRHLFTNRGIDSHLNISKTHEGVVTGRKLLIDRDDFGNSQFFYLQEMLKNLIVISKYSAENYNLSAQGISRVYGKPSRRRKTATAKDVKIHRNNISSFDISSIELPRENANTEISKARASLRQREASYEQNVYKDAKVVLNQYDEKASKMWEQLGVLNTERMLKQDIATEEDNMGFIARDIRKALSLKPSENKSKDASKEDEAKKKRDELTEALDIDTESNSWSERFKSLGLVEKWHYITDKVYKFTEVPSRAISKMLINANNAIYDFFFEKENDLPMGKRVKGWFNLMANRTVDFFDELFKKAKLDLFDPVRKFLGLKEFKDGLKEEIKNSDFYKDYVEATANKFKEKLGLTKATVEAAKPTVVSTPTGYNLDDEYSQNIALGAAFGITPGFEAKEWRQARDEVYYKQLREQNEANKTKRNLVNDALIEASRQKSLELATKYAAKTTPVSSTDAVTAMSYANGFDPSILGNKKKMDKYSSSVMDRLLGPIPKNAYGARYVDKSGITAISKGEMIIPSEMNPFNPDRYRVNKSREKAIEDQKARSFSEKFTESVFGKIGRNAEGTVPKPENGAVQAVANKFKAGKDAIVNYLSGYADVFYASGTDTKSLAYNDVIKNPKKYVPEALAGGGIGAVLGLLTGLGPMAGLVIGAGASVANASDAVKNWLFGETVTDEEGNADGRKGGLVSRETQQKLTQMIPDLKFYGTLGGAAGLFGFAPFGILGGLTLGAAAAYAKNNTKFMEFMFGDKDGIINAERKKWLKDKFPNMAIGTAGAYLFGPFGLLGSAMIGSAAGIVSSTDAFKDTLFGKEMYDGKRHGGILGTLEDNFVDPLVRFSKYMANDMIDFVKNDIMAPFARGIAPLTKYTLYTIRDTVASLANTIGNVGGGILSSLQTFGRYAGFLGSPFAKLAGKAVGGAFLGAKGAVKGLVSLPFKTIGKLGDRAQRKMILSGDEYGMNAAQRYNYARDNGMDLNSATLKADQVLMKSNFEELDAIEKNLQLMISTKAKFTKSVEADKDILERNVRLKVNNPYKADTIIEHLFSTEPGRLDEAIQMLAKSGDYNSSEDRQKFLEYVMQAALSLQRNKSLMKNFESASKNALSRLKDMGIDIKGTKDAKKLLKRIDTEKSAKVKLGEDKNAKDSVDKMVDATTKNADRIVDVLSDIRTLLRGGKVLTDAQKARQSLSRKIANTYSYQLKQHTKEDKANRYKVLEGYKDVTDSHRKRLANFDDKSYEIARYLYDNGIVLDKVNELFSLDEKGADRIVDFVNRTGKKPKGLFKLTTMDKDLYERLVSVAKTINITDIKEVSNESKLLDIETKENARVRFGTDAVLNKHAAPYIKALSSMKADQDAKSIKYNGVDLSDSTTTRKVTKETEDGIVTIVEGSDGSTNYGNDAQTKEALENRKKRFSAFDTMAKLGNFFKGAFSSDDKNQSEPKSGEKTEGFLSRLLGGAGSIFGSIGSKLGGTAAILSKLGLGLLGGGAKVAGVALLSYLVAPHVDDIVGAVSTGVTKLITFLFDSAKTLIDRAPQIAEGVYTGVKNAVFGAKLSAEELAQKGWKETVKVVDGVKKAVYVDENGDVVGEVAQGIWDRSKVGTIVGGAATLGYAGYKAYQGYKALRRAGGDLRRLWTGKNEYKLSELPPDTQAIVSETKETNNILNAIYERLTGNRLSSALDSAGNRRGKVYGTLTTANGTVMRPRGPASKSPMSDSGTGSADGLVNAAKTNLPKLKETISSKLPKAFQPAFDKMSSAVIKRLPGFIGKYGLRTTLVAATGGAGILSYSAIQGLTGFVFGLKDAEEIYGREVSYSERFAAACAGAISGVLWNLITPEDIIGFFNEDGGLEAVEKAKDTSPIDKNSPINNYTPKPASTPKDTSTHDALNAPIGETVGKFFDWLGGTANRAKAADAGKGKYGRGYFKQFDPRYADMQFNAMGDSMYQNMADSGCGPVAAVNALGGANPIDAAQFALKGGFKERDGGTRPEFFKSYFNAHGKDAQYTYGAGIINNLKAGNPVVLMGQSNKLDSNTPYGTGPHYVTATGLDRRGNIIVQDPQDSRSNIKYRASDVLSKTKFGVAARGKFRYGRGRVGNNDLGVEIWNTLEQLGRFKPVAIAGIMGNMFAESSFQPQIVQGGSYAKEVPVGSGVGYGLCQWTTEDRQQGLADFAKSIGRSSGEIYTQCAFVVHEMDAQYSGLFDQLNNSSSATDAALLFHKVYERSADTPQQAARRGEYAEQILKSKGANITDATLKTGGAYKGSSSGDNAMSGIFGYFAKRASKMTNLYNKIFGGSSGSSDGSSDGGSSVGGSYTSNYDGGPLKSNATNAGVDKAISWVSGKINTPGYGDNGCTKFVQDFLAHSDNEIVKNMPLWVPHIMDGAKAGHIWKDAKDGARPGDIAIIETNSNRSDGPDHAVIADGYGGYWGNSSSRNQVVKGSLGGDFGADNILGYVSTGYTTGAKSVATGDLTRSSSDVIADAGTTSGMGKFRYANYRTRTARFGRGPMTEPMPMQQVVSSSSSDYTQILKDIYAVLLTIAENTAALRSGGSTGMDNTKEQAALRLNDQIQSIKDKMNMLKTANGFGQQFLGKNSGIADIQETLLRLATQ